MFSSNVLWNCRMQQESAVDSVKDHCLHLRHFFNDIARTFLADATLLESSVRHQIGTPQWRPVDHHIATLNPSSKL